MDRKIEQDEEWIEKGGEEPGREGARANVKGPHRESQEEHDAEAEEELREQQEAAADHARRLGMVLDSVDKVLGKAPELEVSDELPAETRQALEALYQAKTGEGEGGEYLPGVKRNKLFNEALAFLRPALAMGHLPECQIYSEELDVVREEAAELRHDIQQRMMLELHAGRIPGEQSVDDADKSVKGSKLSKMGSLAWELARLGRKQRKPDDHDPEEHPIADAFNTMARYAFVLGTIGARLALIESRLQKIPETSRKHAVLQRHLATNRMSVVSTLLQFLRSCESDSGVPGDIGSHAVLREKFAGLVKKYGDVTHSDKALPGAIDAVKLIDECLDGGKKLMKKAEKAEPGEKKKKGWFRR